MAAEEGRSKKKDRKLLLLAAGAILGVVLLVYGSLGEKDAERSEAENPIAVENALDPESYAEEVERRVEAICTRVEGAGTVHAVVTLKGGYRAVYAIDSRSSSGGFQNSTVLIGSGSSEEAVLICYENPEISGIGIVCGGGDDPKVREAILSLVAAAFDVKTNKIYIAAG